MKYSNFFLLLLLLIPSMLFGTDYYWVGGSGNWTDINHWATSTGGNIKHIQTPTPSDNVHFDANSSSSDFIVNMSIPTAVCRTLDFAGLTKNLTLNGICTDIRIFGGLKLSQKVKWNISAKFSFEAQQIGNTIQSNHCKMPFHIYFLNSSGGWILADSLKTKYSIFHKAGNLNTNGKFLKCRDYISTGSLQRYLSLGSSDIVVKSINIDGQGFGINAGTSNIYMLSPLFTVNNCGNKTFYNLHFETTAATIESNNTLTFNNVWMFKNGVVTCDAIYNNLYLTRSYEYVFNMSTTQTFNGNLVAQGECWARIGISSSGATTNFIKNSGTMNIYHILLKGIAAGGGAIFNAWSSFDLGGNSGWNIQVPPSRNLYWVGDSGRWEDSIHWSLSSGGTGGECIPTLIDDVYFDNNSFSAQGYHVTITDTAGNCHDMRWNTTKNPVFNGNNNKIMRISGSMWFCTNMTNDFEGNIIFVSGNQGEVVQTANHNILGPVDFNGEGGWSLLDSLKIKPSLTLTKGTLNTNNQYVRCKNLSLWSKKRKKLYLTSSRVDIIDGIMGIRQDSTYINPGTSEIHLYSIKSMLKTTHSPQRRLWTVIFEEDSIGIYSKFLPVNTKFHKIIYRGNIIKKGNLTVDSIFYSAGYDYQFEGKDSILAFLRAKGYCTKKITFRPVNPMINAKIFKNTGSLTVERVHMRGITAVGNANFTAVNSANLGHNINWTFQNTITNLYWVGDSGRWNDSLNWSFSSGGQGGACIPSINDNVFFDQNSFSAQNSVVLADVPNIFCRDMNWDPNLPYPVMKTKYSNLFIAGSMNLSRKMDFNFKGFVYFCDTTKGKHILSSGQDFDSTVIFIDTGSWVQSDSMIIKDVLMLMEGHLSTDSNYLRTEHFNAYNPYTRSFDISGSEVILNGTDPTSNWYWFSHSSSFFKAVNSNVYFKNKTNNLYMSGQGTVNFHNIFFVPDNATAKITASTGISNFNNKVVFGCMGNIYGSHEYDTLIFTRNHYYSLAVNSHQYINKLLKADGNCSKKITISSDGTKSYIHKNQGVVTIHEVMLKNIEAQGNAVFSAYGGKDMGGNVNWNFYPNPPRTLYWVGGNGDWTDTIHWSLQSGGPGGECIPTYIDDVIIDALSSNTKNFQSLIIPQGGGAECHNLWWKSFSNTIFKGSIDIYGGMNISKPLKTLMLNVNFLSNGSSNVIKTGNNTLLAASFNGTGGWKLQDSLFVKDSILFNAGYLKTNGHMLKALSFVSPSKSKKRLELGNSLIQLQHKWRMCNDSLTLNAGKSEILFKGGLNYLFENTGKTQSDYYNLSVLDEMSGLTTFKNRDTAIVTFNKVKVFNDGDFFEKYIFDSLIFAPGNTYRFNEGLQQVVNDYWFIRGNNCYAINLQSTKMFNEAFVFKPMGFVEGDFINMRDIHANSSAKFYAGSFSTDIDNNKNWIFLNGPNYVYGLGPDTNFSLGQNLVITTTNFNGSSSTLYNWSTGSTHDTIVVNKTGWYWVTVTYSNNCEIVDSIYVGCKVNLKFNITDAKCYGDTNGVISIIIPDTNYIYSYLWSTGDTTQTIQPYPAGTYIVQVTADSGKCQITDTALINQPPKVVIPQGDTAFCIGDSVMLDIGLFKKYFWSDGYGNRTRWVSKPDTFYVYVENFKGCKSFGDTIAVRQDSMPVVALGSDTAICLGQTIVLKPVSGYTSYEWWDGGTGETAEVNFPGTYWVLVRNHTCYAYDTIFVDNCPPELTVPNVFTPNGDGINDYFTPKEQNILDFDLKIYNRWGMRIYHTNDLKHGWDGSYMNQPAAEGVYFFVIEYREWLGTEAGPLKKTQGTVTLLRNSRY
jgi:gliding motility-associated-like protein